MHSSRQWPLPRLTLSIHWFPWRLGSFLGELSVHTHTQACPVGGSINGTGRWRTQRWAGPRSYQLERAHCAPLFPTPCSVSARWWLETAHGVRIYTMESNWCFKSELPHPHSPSQMLNIYEHTTVTPLERERVEGMRCLEWQATFSNMMWGYHSDGDSLPILEASVGAECPSLGSCPVGLERQGLTSRVCFWVHVYIPWEL